MAIFCYFRFVMFLSVYVMVAQAGGSHTSLSRLDMASSGAVTGRSSSSIDSSARCDWSLRNMCGKSFKGLNGTYLKEKFVGDATAKRIPLRGTQILAQAEAIRATLIRTVLIAVMRKIQQLAVKATPAPKEKGGIRILRKGATKGMMMSTDSSDAIHLFLCAAALYHTIECADLQIS